MIHKEAPAPSASLHSHFSWVIYLLNPWVEIVGYFHWVLITLIGLFDNPTLKVVLLGLGSFSVGLNFLWDFIGWISLG